MPLKKTYYSISEVSKMLNIQQHTIIFWDSKLPDLSKRDTKGKTTFFIVLLASTKFGSILTMPDRIAAFQTAKKRKI